MRELREDTCRAWLTTGFLKPWMTREIMETFGTATAVYEAFCRREPSLLELLQPHEREALQVRENRSEMNGMAKTMQRLGIHVMYQEEDIYPELLKHIDDPPALLFYRGNPECLRGRCITMVGARAASTEGLRAAEKIAGDLARNGVCIVSGMAYGIDAASHQGCVDADGQSVGVLACGLDVDYPQENGALKQAMLDKGGLLLSELPLGCPAKGEFFSRRNRILSGLSWGTVMVECRIRSGTMLTVHHALDQGREVLVWPGVPGSIHSEGAHTLLREGARYITCAEDILEDMDWLNTPAVTPAQRAALPPMTTEQQKIYQVLQQGTRSLDELAQETGMGAPELSSSLTMLQLAGLVHQEPGRSYGVN